MHPPENDRSFYEALMNEIHRLNSDHQRRLYSNSWIVNANNAIGDLTFRFVGFGDENEEESRPHSTLQERQERNRQAEIEHDRLEREEWEARQHKENLAMKDYDILRHMSGVYNERCRFLRSSRTFVIYTDFVFDSDINTVVEVAYLIKQYLIERPYRIEISTSVNNYHKTQIAVHVAWGEEKPDAES